ncbi:uncharacterized protein ATC70_010458 [Mucor velutinosus]|uniref:Uncharacterized protein n=1 Tax=Mucor velutinosus TaxID=708070 RepID=A0AAN7DE79_9FUNG|nr:hypothetical protein ATC70_010458 [Mucor velutinosus]
MRNDDPREAIGHKQSIIKHTKQKLFQLIVDSYRLEHRISAKHGILQHKSIPFYQVKQHKEDNRTARHRVNQAEETIMNSIDEMK